MQRLIVVLSLAFASLLRPSRADAQDPGTAKPGRSPSQAIDKEYTRKIREYTTEPFFLSPLVDYLPEGRSDRRERDPVYYITGAIHSPEAGAPTALMELTYRLAVDESPYVKNMRDHLITLITPIVEVDGRDRMVDLFNWHMKHPGETYPSLLYWGHYVAHDNNRDAMGMTLKLTQNVQNTYVDWKAQVLHDLHESVAYLYDNTIGDGPRFLSH